MRLFLLLFTLAATVLAGIGVTAILAAGLDGWKPLVLAASIGAVLGVPVAYLAARKIANL